MKKTLLILAACVIAAGCAENDSATTGQEAQEYLDLLLVNFPGAQEQNGVYILEDLPGQGELWDANRAYTYASFTIRTMKGAVSSSTEESVAKQLGTYVKGNYYGPKYSSNGAGISYAGVDAMLTGMRVGGSRTAIIPAWMLTTSRLDSKQAYLDACTSTTSLIYSITLMGQTDDIIETQKDSLLRYVTRHYGSGYSRFTIEGYEDQFYFVSDSSAFEGKDKREETATLQMNYTGRLLNGQVFDTTDEKTAKDAGIYSAANTYSVKPVVFSANYTEISMDGSSNLIKGFQAGLQKMKWAGQKATVIFGSNLGYGASSSGDMIPAYSPLVFELEIK